MTKFAAPRKYNSNTVMRAECTGKKIILIALLVGTVQWAKNRKNVQFRVSFKG